MRRFVVGLAVALAATVAPAANGQPPAQDSVTGTGVAQAGAAFDFVIDARSGPSGENPTGQVVFTSQESGTTFFNGSVTCLAVQGNVGIVVVATPQYGNVTMEVTDSPTGDLIRAIPTAPITPCGPPGIAVDFRVTSGDVQVVDAQPLPTSKEQCKHGGWRNFPGFKNQGDCVSFVAKRKP
jgi:hypothetical protein